MLVGEKCQGLTKKGERVNDQVGNWQSADSFFVIKDQILKELLNEILGGE